MVSWAWIFMGRGIFMASGGAVRNLLLKAGTKQKSKAHPKVGLFFKGFRAQGKGTQAIGEFRD
jgi:hypothetical protein